MVPKETKFSPRRRTLLKRLPWFLLGGVVTATLATLMYNVHKPEEKGHEEPLELAIRGKLEEIEIVDRVNYSITRTSGDSLYGSTEIAVYRIRTDTNSYSLVGIGYGTDVSIGKHYSIVYLEDKEVTVSEILERNIVKPLREQFKDLKDIYTTSDPRKTYIYDGHLLRLFERGTSV